MSDASAPSRTLEILTLFFHVPRCQLAKNYGAHYNTWYDNDGARPVDIFGKFLRSECRFQKRAAANGWQLGATAAPP